MKMERKTKVEHLGLEILTPVHCGSGKELLFDCDYIKKDNHVFVVDQEKTFSALATGDAQLDGLLSKTGTLTEWVSLAGEYHGYKLSAFGNSGTVPEKMREHLKDAHFNPYIAGSSLKGAIRTALIAEHLRNLRETNSDDFAVYLKLLPNENPRTHKPSVAKERAASDLLKKLVGKGPKEDIFRALLVKDAQFTPQDLSLVDVRCLNLTGFSNPFKVSWLSLTGRRNFTDWRQADGFSAEMLTPKATTHFYMQWDGFLLSDLSWQSDKTNKLLPTNFQDLKARLNAHAKYRLQQEIDFYKSNGMTKPQEKCQEIQNRIDKEQDSIFLQLSWGSGWKAMTGDWLDDVALKQIRKLYRLGKDDMPFPKTRRLGVIGEPKLPLGWIRLFPYTHQEKAHNEPQQQTIPSQTEAKTGQATAALNEFIKDNGYSGLSEAIYRQAQQENWQTCESNPQFYQTLLDYIQQIKAEPDVKIQQDAIAIISDILEKKYPQILQNPDRTQGKKAKPAYKEMPIKIAKSLLNLRKP